MKYLFLLWPLAGLIFFALYGSRGFWLNMRGGTVIFFVSLIAGPLSFLALLINF